MLAGSRLGFLPPLVHVSPGSAETLVRRGGVTNNPSIAYSLSNVSAKNYQNRLICVEVIVCNIVSFFETRCISGMRVLRGGFTSCTKCAALFSDSRQKCVQFWNWNMLKCSWNAVCFILKITPWRNECETCMLHSWFMPIDQINQDGLSLCSRIGNISVAYIRSLLVPCILHG